MFACTCLALAKRSLRSSFFAFSTELRVSWTVCGAALHGRAEAGGKPLASAVPYSGFDGDADVEEAKESSLLSKFFILCEPFELGLRQVSVDKGKLCLTPVELSSLCERPPPRSGGCLCACEKSP